jgi:hypothetical protein
MPPRSSRSSRPAPAVHPGEGIAAELPLDVGQPAPSLSSPPASPDHLDESAAAAAEEQAAAFLQQVSDPNRSSANSPQPSQQQLAAGSSFLPLSAIAPVLSSSDNLDLSADAVLQASAEDANAALIASAQELLARCSRTTATGPVLALYDWPSQHWQHLFKHC